MAPPDHDLLLSKRGAGAWYFAGVQQALQHSGVSWFYAWSGSPADQAIDVPPGIEFVPMIWGRSAAQDGSIKAAAKYSVLLGFNEPDRPDQANMRVEEALELWPHLMAAQLRLGSPAPAFTDGSDE
ncbi:hypothetical protein WJX74_000854 [Apatococcus lobatus]|uniref:Asl1-like glycosyl hydrolase catalytic domain-containing protein n=1 Tax=Apatococcus lobatus TaxID=904363 RepID=A0AAW1SDJ1_9CHLO